jgi:hypothetical protein
VPIWIAGYAALVATASLAWQLVRHFRERKPRLRVTGFVNHFITKWEDNEALVQAKTDPELAKRLQWRVDVEVYNEGDSGVQMDRVTVRQPFTAGGGSRNLELLPTGEPHYLESHRSAALHMTDEDDAAQLDHMSEMHATVTIADGTVFESQPFGGEHGNYVTMPQPLMAQLLAEAGKDEASIYKYEVSYPGPVESAES